MIAKKSEIDSSSMRAKRFRLFSDEHRIRILELLSQQEMNVGEISMALGIAQSLASHHLRALRLEKILSTKRSGKTITYKLAPSIQKDANQKIFDLGCCRISLK